MLLEQAFRVLNAYDLTPTTRYFYLYICSLVSFGESLRVSNADLATSCKLSESTVFHCKLRLEKAGLIKIVKHGVYDLEDGQYNSTGPDTIILVTSVKQKFLAEDRLSYRRFSRQPNTEFAREYLGEFPKDHITGEQE